MSESGRDTAAQGSPSNGPWWKDVIEVSALVTVLAATVYVVGLFALLVPLTTTITHDFSTSWYAVSLIPQMTVIGEGVSTLFGYPLLLVAFLVVLPFVLPFIVDPVRAVVRRIRKPGKGFAPGGIHKRHRFHSYAEWFKQEKLNLKWIAAIYVGYSILHLILYLIFGYGRPLSSVILIIGGISGYVAGDFMGLAMARKKGRIFPYIADRNWFFSALAVIYIGVVINGFIIGAIQDPSLLYVTMDLEEANGGRLITHADGYWHVFDSEGNLIAVPDDDAGLVHTSSEPPA